jgi:hypothetical protein
MKQGYKGNGGNKKIGNVTFDQEVEYPVSFEMKVIVDAKLPEAETRKQLANVYDTTSVPHKIIHHRLSKEGKYISFTIAVTIDSKEILELLYERLKGISGMKMAI